MMWETFADLRGRISLDRRLLCIDFQISQMANLGYIPTVPKKNYFSFAPRSSQDAHVLPQITPVR